MRKRTPSPEQQHSDKKLVELASGILTVVGMRYPGSPLDLATRLAREFLATPVVERKRKPKAKPPTLPMTLKEALQPLSTSAEDAFIKAGRG